MTAHCPQSAALPRTAKPWRTRCATAAIVAAAVCGNPAMGQSRVGPSPLGGGAAPMPPEVQQAGIDQLIGNDLPLNASFVDETGKPVKLGDYFDGKRPVVIEFAYFDCPVLCPMVVSGIIDATEKSGWVPGEQFEILTISINPDDTPVGSLEKQDEVVQTLSQNSEALGQAAREGWHFLTGREADIKAVADAAGFGYAAVPATSDYAHAAAIIFASPGGRITRYLPGHVYPERDYKMALVEASEGKQGSLFDMVLQLCYHYDDSRGRYTADAIALMKFAGAVTVVTLTGVIGSMFYFERKRHHRLDDRPDTPQDQETA